MKAYDTRHWFSALAIHRTDMFMKLWPWLLGAGVFTAGVCWAEREFLHLTKESHVNNLTILHSLLGFVISLLLVFRTNTAYDRWWEGRKLWGQLVNVSRNLAVKIDAYV